MRTRWLLGILLGFVVMNGSSAEAAKWSRQYIRQLPDSAFAAIETTPEGKRLRYLPHHDAQGNLDLPHLLSALSRLRQVKWRDPANAEVARQHLKEHLEEYRRERIAAVSLKIPVNLNTASEAELAQLPFLGPRRARAIVADREARGAFAEPEDLKRVRGIGPQIYDAIADLVTVK